MSFSDIANIFKQIAFNADFLRQNGTHYAGGYDIRLA